MKGRERKCAPDAARGEARRPRRREWGRFKSRRIQRWGGMTTWHSRPDLQSAAVRWRREWGKKKKRRETQTVANKNFTKKKKRPHFHTDEQSLLKPCLGFLMGFQKPYG